MKKEEAAPQQRSKPSNVMRKPRNRMGVFVLIPCITMNFTHLRIFSAGRDMMTDAPRIRGITQQILGGDTASVDPGRHS